eukprot:353600-Chlamydomonas_euryale.AAC.9
MRYYAVQIFLQARLRPNKAHPANRGPVAQPSSIRATAASFLFRRARVGDAHPSQAHATPAHPRVASATPRRPKVWARNARARSSH